MAQNQTILSRTNPQAVAEENARFMTKVYTWMTFGLLTTFAIAYYIAQSPEAIGFIFQNRAIFYGLVIAQLGLVFTLSLAIKRISAMAATLLFFAYAALTGVTMASIFFVYTQLSIANVFLVTSFSFAGLSAFGYFTKRDLGPVGSFCTMGLFGLIGFMLVSMFFPSVGGSYQMQTAASLLGVVVFAGLTAYDTQKIKSFNIAGGEGTEEERKGAIIGALMLYLDFINMFLMLLRLMGNRK